MRKRVLVTVLTYPCPSHKYIETVCTAGVTEEGKWIRVYPLQQRYLGKKIQKWNWYDFDLEQRPSQKDLRRESYHCLSMPDRSSGFIPSKDNWSERRHYCIDNVEVYRTIEEWEKAIVVEEGKRPSSLGTFKPASILNFEAVPVDTTNLDKEKQEILDNLYSQLDLFEEEKKELRNQYWKMAESIPYRFYYRFRDFSGVEKRLMIEDWEVFELYRKCRDNYCRTEEEAIAKVREKYLDEFSKKDIYFFLGTRLEQHRRRLKTPYSIIGVFYPSKNEQLSMF